eukprot:gnl/TRDRNA2_/TRDRNA2_146210_c1_seq1.p1 gnl/TRDRNA2_/TRDRNA2_146210_c1~~gnl/TRDRNA2_/TRDRNA2_146210_c1_seq1.p1  ORF type:complete len:139 (+),score=15.07 gnl/TRDRNA2_/TRDRNA2_146210_c1_seq1:167-583(+)
MSVAQSLLAVVKAVHRCNKEVRKVQTSCPAAADRCMTKSTRWPARGHLLGYSVQEQYCRDLLTSRRMFRVNRLTRAFASDRQEFEKGSAMSRLQQKQQQFCPKEGQMPRGCSPREHIGPQDIWRWPNPPRPLYESKGF